MSTEPMNVSEPPAVAPDTPAASEAPQAEPNPTEKLRKRIVFGFTGTVVIGFALAGWYVGGRIFANDKPQRVVAANAPPPVRATATSPSAKPAAGPAPVLDFHAVTPTPAVAAVKPSASPASVSSAKPAVNTAPAHPASFVPAVAAAKPAPIATALPETPKARPTLPPQPSWSVVEPRPREKYLQVAALGRRTTTTYVQELQAKGFRPLVGPGPSDGIFRILVGPFPDKMALDQAQNALHAAGIEPFVRSY